jgi:CO dehydrogenase/acetyl-CoA synthase gamma subunit (corrinoid Fe-S protein)
MVRQATGIAKAKTVAQFARLMVEAGEPVLLVGWHREVYRIWLEALADLKPAMYVTGGVKIVGCGRSGTRGAVRG